MIKAAPLLALLLLPPALAQALKNTGPDEPANPQPPATTFHDTKYRLSFNLPAGWNVARQDGILSTFRTEVRTARPGLQLRAVASLGYNPYPPTTFAGAAVYYSVLPAANAAACARQAAAPPLTPRGDAVIAGALFHHGEEHHGSICTEARDDVYTTLRGNTCLRFDMVVNTFCHASSGALDLTPAQLGNIAARMTGILASIRLE